MDLLHYFKEKPVIQYGFVTALISAFFGLILFGISFYILKYGNYSNSLSGYILGLFFLMSITAALLAAYKASRDPDQKGISKNMKFVYGIIAALIVSLFPVLIYAVIACFFMNDTTFNNMLSLQFYITPLPAAVLGGLIGYFIEGNYSCFGTKMGLKKYIMVLSSVLLLELAVFLIIIFGVIGMEFVPFDPGRVMKP